MAELNKNALTRLTTVAGVDMNIDTAQTLYVVPVGVSCVISHVVVRSASISLTTASYSFGFTGAAYNDVIANAAHTELTGATLYTILSAKVGSKIGVAASLFSAIMNTKQGAAATTTIDVYGYLF
jgi:hypothetical protein